MRDLKILHTADLHLDSPFEGLSAGKAAMRRGEQRQLLARLAAEKDFGLTEEEMRAVLDPSKYTGRCGAQVTALAEKLRPLFAEADESSVSIDV